MWPGVWFDINPNNTITHGHVHSSSGVGSSGVGDEGKGSGDGNTRVMI